MWPSLISPTPTLFGSHSEEKVLIMKSEIFLNKPDERTLLFRFLRDVCLSGSVTSVLDCATCACGGSSPSPSRRCGSSSGGTNCGTSCCWNVFSSWSTQTTNRLIQSEHWQDPFKQNINQTTGFWFLQSFVVGFFCFLGGGVCDKSV